MTKALVRVTGDASYPVAERVDAGRELAEHGDPRPGVGIREDGLPEFCWTDWTGAGFFVMGSSEADVAAFDNEKPQHSVRVERFRLGRYPVTNRQFRAFVESPDGWASDSFWSEAGIAWRKSVDAWQQHGNPDNFPCVNVSWYAAVAFAEWASAHCVVESGCKLRLPTEPEWERACRGTDGRLYAWGSEFDANRCNMKDTGIGTLCSVGLFPGGMSPVGALDMLGGTWEWCMSLAAPYPYGPGREDIGTAGNRVIRGGAYNQDKAGVRCGVRREDPPEHSGERISFRLSCIQLL